MLRIVHRALYLIAASLCGAAAAAHCIETEPGVHIRYVERAPERSDRSVLMIPGWGFSAEIWEAQMQALGGRWRVVAIDPRSQGESTKAPNGNTPEVRARDIQRVIEKLDLRNVVLVGWSQGVQDVISHAPQFAASGASPAMCSSTRCLLPDRISLRRRRRRRSSCCHGWVCTWRTRRNICTA